MWYSKCLQKMNMRRTRGESATAIAGAFQNCGKSVSSNTRDATLAACSSCGAPWAECKHLRTRNALLRLNAGLERQARSIGQALHDEAGQFLTAAYNSLAQASSEVPACARPRLQEVRRHLEHVEEQLRRLSHELRPRILDDLGLVPAIRFIVQGMKQRHAWSIDLQSSVDGRLDPAVETAVYRFVQEALTNIGRHAGAAHVTIRVRRRGAGLRCSIRDDGVGFDGKACHEQGLGLSGIRDRLDIVGGTLRITSSPGRGTELLGIIPLESPYAPPPVDRRRSSHRS